MTTPQAHSLLVSALAMVANLGVAGITLSYVRETEHRLTTLEAQLAMHDCRFNPIGCKQQQSSESPGR